MAAKKAQPSMGSMMRAMRKAPAKQAMRMDQMLDKRLGSRDKTDQPSKRKGR